MTLLLVRHASAGKRSRWRGDRLRPLDGRGRRQSEHLVEALAGYEVNRVLTSPYVRCRQTVEPLAAARGLPLEERDELAEGADAAALGLVAELQDASAVLCTHGDVVLALLGVESKKGSAWILEIGADEALTRRDYLPPGA
jgi:phosphohistidine phosphatase SixA